MSPSGLNSRGERALYAQLVGLRNSLTEQGGSLAGAAAGQQLDAATAVGAAQMGQQGENQRALPAAERVRDVTALSEAAATNRAMIQPPQYQTDAEGNLVQVTGATAQPVTSGGQPVKMPQGRVEGAITPAVVLDSLTRQLAAEAGALQPNPDRMA